jgi:RsmE family RNA methyltransferase
VNLLLFRPGEIERPLPAADPRARHLLDVLRRRVGGEFDAGLLNGPRGRGRIEHIATDALTLSFQWTASPPAADPLTLLLGLPRPQTARDILRDATTLGAAALHFVATEKSEPSYAQSSLWRDGEWERHVLAGAEQAFTTLVPEVTSGRSLVDALAGLPAAGPRLALDNYEATAALAGQPCAPAEPLVLALGPERGWGPADRVALRAAGFTLVHLGPRVLRLETAVVAALTLAKAARGTL